MTAAGAISNGELRSLELSVASNAAISVAGVTIATTADNPLTFGYVLAADNEFTVTGSATVSIPGLGSSVDVTTAGVVSDGELQSLDLDVVANQVLTVSGVSVTANTLSFSYLLSEGNQFTVEGNATIEVLRHWVTRLTSPLVAPSVMTNCKAWIWPWSPRNIRSVD